MKATKVPLSSLVGHTPVTVRFADDTVWRIDSVSVVNEAFVSVVFSGRSNAKSFPQSVLVEVLPAKQTPLELERAALLALVERVANSNLWYLEELIRIRADARDLLAQLKP